jgi:hypothetical protein
MQTVAISRSVLPTKMLLRILLACLVSISNGPVTESDWTHLGWLTDLLADYLPLVCIVLFDRGKQRSTLLTC